MDGVAGYVTPDSFHQYQRVASTETAEINSGITALEMSLSLDDEKTDSGGVRTPIITKAGKVDGVATDRHPKPSSTNNKTVRFTSPLASESSTSFVMEPDSASLVTRQQQQQQQRTNGNGSSSAVITATGLQSPTALSSDVGVLNALAPPSRRVLISTLMQSLFMDIQNITNDDSDLTADHKYRLTQTCCQRCCSSKSCRCDDYGCRCLSCETCSVEEADTTIPPCACVCGKKVIRRTMFLFSALMIAVILAVVMILATRK